MMAGFTQTVSTVNSLIRTLIALAVCAVLGIAGWVGYDAYQSSRSVWFDSQRELIAARQTLAERETTIDELNDSVQKQKQELNELATQLAQSHERIDRLETSLQLLKVDQRLARVAVLRQRTDPESKRIFSTVEFVETNESGEPIDAPRVFEIEGDLIYVDYWVVKFEDKYVEHGTVDRSASICLFRRIFGEHQEPSEGFVIDKVGTRPPAYARDGQMSEFEQTVWNDFWNIANDPQKARFMGIRAAHGEAVSTRLLEGRKYQLKLRASGGLSIAPLETDDANTST